MHTEFGVMDDKDVLCGMPQKTFGLVKHAHALLQGLQEATERAAGQVDIAAARLEAKPIMSVRERAELLDEVRIGQVMAGRTFRVVQREVGLWQPTI